MLLLLLLLGSILQTTSAQEAPTYSSNPQQEQEEHSLLLPPGLQIQTTTRTYWYNNETRDTYVPFPPEAESLLLEEIKAIPYPLKIQVITTITHWHNPLWHLLRGIVHRMRAQNQIIYVTAYYYIVDGFDVSYGGTQTQQQQQPSQQITGCRQYYVINNATTGQPQEQEVNSSICEEQCTNHGRYCAPQPPPLSPSITTTQHNDDDDDDDNDNDVPLSTSNSNNKMVVEETLRRLCINELYHTTDLHHWEYLDAFEEFSCHTLQYPIDVAECSQRALSTVEHTNWTDVLQCMDDSGGLEEDRVNTKLQSQLDRIHAQQRLPFTVSNLPQLFIGEETMSYSGVWDVEHLLSAICEAFPQNNATMTPLACQFCAPCRDARECLWFLNCDGMPFNVSQMVPPPSPPSPISAPPMETTISASVATTTSPTSMTTTDPPPIGGSPPPLPSTVSPSPAEEEGAKYDPMSLDVHAYFFGGILIGIIAGLIPALLLYWDEKKTRKTIRIAQSLRAAAAEEGEWTSQSVRGRTYQDDDDDDDYDDAGGSDRGNNNFIGAASAPYFDDDNEYEDLGKNLGVSERGDAKGGDLGVSHRPTPGELEDVDLAIGNQGKQQQPPKMAFNLHQFIV